MRVDELRAQFADPPREFGMVPFWFWNDDLEDVEILRQIGEFHAQGCAGFIPHARIGLSRRIGYLTPAYFRVLRVAVEEASRLSMKVVLYDEASYPSGSAHGRVVAENPAYASRCLIAVQQAVCGPVSGYWRPNPGRGLDDRLLTVMAVRETSDGVGDPQSLTRLPLLPHELIRYDLPAGNWRLVSVWSVPSGGSIRGVFADEDDGAAGAPAAADILNPDAVACFIRHTHEQFLQHIGDHFGHTIPAMFTDEPCPLGRNPRRGPAPYAFTSGLLEELQPRWDGDILCWLPALWLDLGARGAAFRQAYGDTVHDRLNRVYYGALAAWCDSHGLALTGHPERSDEMGALACFQWPGQDMVWRYVTPAGTSALAGPHSTAAKAAHSAAVLAGRRFNAAEILGAYGWQLTLDETKWLFDWHAVRGNNLFFPHAFFYSIRDRRAFESEPDLGIHNVWWPYWGALSAYVRRLCALFSDGEEVLDVGVVVDADSLPWRAAAALFQTQTNFVYVDVETLCAAELVDGGLRLGPRRVWVRALLADPPGALDARVRARFDALVAAGGQVIRDWTDDTLPVQLQALPQRSLRWDGPPALRVRCYRKGGHALFLLVNEGESEIVGTITIPFQGRLECWNPLDGTVQSWPVRRDGDGMRVDLRLERRQGLVLVVAPGPVAAVVVEPACPGDAVQELAGPWEVSTPEGERLPLCVPGDWARLKGWELFSGTIRYQCAFAATAETVRTARYLDLGAVGDLADATLNGQPLGMRAWSPHVFSLLDALHVGSNVLNVLVTNSMANAYEGRQRTSGLFGPVVLRPARVTNGPTT
ncbi:MAG: hypothetical protein K8T26_17350 [Lentisphaerae bacterium]|nr:hypothetical protein [Lentisphaerota bacterium]